MQNCFQHNLSNCLRDSGPGTLRDNYADCLACSSGFSPPNDRRCNDELNSPNCPRDNGRSTLPDYVRDSTIDDVRYNSPNYAGGSPQVGVSVSQPQPKASSFKQLDPKTSLRGMIRTRLIAAICVSQLNSGNHQVGNRFPGDSALWFLHFDIWILRLLRYARFRSILRRCSFVAFSP
jgi:hypothetical protein